MTTPIWIGIGLIALFIIGKIMMSVGKVLLWILLIAGIGVLGFAGAQHMGWIQI